MALFFISFYTLSVLCGGSAFGWSQENRFRWRQLVHGYRGAQEFQLPLRLQFEFPGTGGDDDGFAAVEDHGPSAPGRYDPPTADGRPAPDRWGRLGRAAGPPRLIEVVVIPDKMGRRHPGDLRLVAPGV